MNKRLLDSRNQLLTYAANTPKPTVADLQKRSKEITREIIKRLLVF